MIEFDIQLFGDNDTVTASYELNLGFERADETVQYLKIKQPSYNLEPADPSDFMTYAITGQFLLDESTGEPFSLTSIFTAYTVEKSIRKLDIS